MITALLVAAQIVGVSVPVEVQGVATAPPAGAEHAPIVRVTVDAPPEGARVTALSVRAANKRGDPQVLQVVDRDTGAVLGRMPLDVSGDKPRYVLAEPFPVPAGGALDLTARTTENWARLVARRKLSRTVAVTLTDAAGAPLALRIDARKRPKGVEHDAEASEDPSRMPELVPGTRPTADPAEWVLPAGEHRFDADLVVPRAVTLRIEAGATLKLAVGRSLISFGRLLVEGTPERPVRFEPQSEGAWGSVALIGFAAGGSVLRGAHFVRGSQSWSGADDLLGMVEIRDTTVTIEGCVFEDTRGEDAVHVIRGRAAILGSRFTNTGSDAVDFDSSIGEIRGSVFDDIADDAIDTGESRVTVSAVRIEGTGGKAVSAGTDSRVHVSDSVIVRPGRGISAFDGARVTVVNTALVGAVRGALEGLHRDGERPGFIAVERSLLWGNGNDDEGRREGRVVLTQSREDVPVDLQDYRPIRAGGVVIGPPGFPGVSAISPAAARARQPALEAGSSPVATTDGGTSMLLWWLAGAAMLLAVMLGADLYARLRR